MFSITGLTNGQLYSVLLKAVNINGAGSASNSASATPSTTPSAPTINSATPGNQSITIAYSPPSDDGGAAITSYQYSLNGGSYTFALVSNNMFSITGLTNGQLYSVLLQAVNTNGAGSASNSASATPGTPSAPILFTATHGYQSITILLTVNDGGSPITNYYYSTNGGLSFTLFSPPQTSTSQVVIDNLDNGTSYNVALKAVNANGTGSVSNVLTNVIPCLCRRMKILTPHGPVPVESLREGDLVQVPPFQRGRTAPIQRIFCSTYVGTQENLPVRIPQHFFEHNIPNEDILLSPHHAVFYNGQWRLPMEIDGLDKEESYLGKEFEYYHVELPEYLTDKMWCHNLPVDSWDYDGKKDPLEQEKEASVSSSTCGDGGGAEDTKAGLVAVEEPLGLPRPGHGVLTAQWDFRLVLLQERKRFIVHDIGTASGKKIESERPDPEVARHCAVLEKHPAVMLHDVAGLQPIDVEHAFPVFLTKRRVHLKNERHDFPWKMHYFIPT
jgi:Hint domain